MANKNPVNNTKTSRGKNKRAGNVELTAEQKRDVLAKQWGIKPRTKAFVDELLKDPSISQTEAYIRTHDTDSKKTAGIQASRLLKKSSVIGYKDSAVQKAKRRIVTLVDSDNESIALKASESIIDRVEGKAVQKSENISKTVEVKLDLTGLRIGAHYVQAEQLPASDQNS